MILLILLLALVLRIINLNQSLWLDEATQALLSSKSINSIFFERSADFHPPLFYLLMHFWIKFGTSEVWLRLLPVIFGVLTVYGVYLLAQSIFGKKVALVSALLLSVAPYHIYYSQEIRMYSLAAMLAVFSMYFFWKFVEDGKNWHTNIASSLSYTLTAVLLLYTHYLGFLLIIAQLLYMIMFRFQKRSLFLINLLFVAFLGSFWLPQFFKQLSAGVNTNTYFPGWGEMLGTPFYKFLPLIFLKFSIGRISFDNRVVYSIVALSVFCLFGYFLFLALRKIKNNNIKFLSIWLFVPILLSLIISFWLPLDQPFRLLFVLPAFYILLAFGLTSQKRLEKIGLFLIVLTSLFSLLIYNTDKRFSREDWRGAVSFINTNIQDNDVVIFEWPSPFPPYIFYGGNEKTISLADKLPVTEEMVSSKLRFLNSGEVYLFEYLQPLSDPNREAEKWLKDNSYILKETDNFNGVGFIYKFEKTGGQK